MEASARAYSMATNLSASALLICAVAAASKAEMSETSGDSMSLTI